MKYFIQSAVIALFVFAAVLALAIVFGAPKDPPPMKRITQPFKEIRVNKEKEQFVARDGSRLTYRRYPASLEPAKGSVVLLHGSGASSDSMHPPGASTKQSKLYRLCYGHAWTRNDKRQRRYCLYWPVRK